VIDRTRDIEFGYDVLRTYHTKELVSPDWLATIGFTENDCADFAITGTSRHTVVGLLRSSRATELNLSDIQAILAQLRPAEADSFAKLRLLAKGLDVQLDPREPWESGYELARRVRDRLSLQIDDWIEIDNILKNLEIDHRELRLTDIAVRGACIGNPRYRPTVILNTACRDASGVSGRRITLAHELCHLLFDRSRMRGLARVEGGAADSERMFEMRANAFAVEFLVPREVLFDANGEDEIARLAENRGISYHALSAHAENVRRRMA
jgi:Zn-dependent peptidase ImmA (M78 family)